MERIIYTKTRNFSGVAGDISVFPVSKATAAAVRPGDPVLLAESGRGPYSIRFRGVVDSVSAPATRRKRSGYLLHVSGLSPVPASFFETFTPPGEMYRPMSDYVHNSRDFVNLYNLFTETRRKGYPVPDNLRHSFALAWRNIDRNHYRPDRLAVPLTEGWRHLLDNDGGGKDYIIVPGRAMTEEEALDFLQESPVYVGDPYPSPYDCTGRAFTAWWSYRNTPAGTVIIHRWCLDI